MFLGQWNKLQRLLLLSWLAKDALARQSLISLTPEILSGCIADKLVHLAPGPQPTVPSFYTSCQTKSKCSNCLNFKLKTHVEIGWECVIYDTFLEEIVSKLFLVVYHQANWNIVADPEYPWFGLANQSMQCRIIDWLNRFGCKLAWRWFKSNWNLIGDKSCILTRSWNIFQR